MNTTSESSFPSRKEHIALQFVLAAVISELCKTDGEARQRMQDFVLKAANSNMLGLHSNDNPAQNQAVMEGSHLALSLISSAAMY